MGIINGNERKELLREITGHRPLAAIPFAGRYRIIDFILSGMVNSGIQNVGILVRDPYRSLMDHLRSGKEWDLARKRDGLFILPPSSAAKIGDTGDIENLVHNLDYITSSRQQYVLLTGSSLVCNINYRKVFQFHLQSHADITMLYKEEEGVEPGYRTVLTCRKDGRVTGIAVNPPSAVTGKLSLGMCLMAKKLLVELAVGCKSRGGQDLLQDGLIRNLDRLHIYGYPYKGYLARIDSIASYYRHNMELLNPEKRQELFFKSGLVYTKVKDGAPAKYKASAGVVNAMITNGCVIAGRVENSLLFRDVTIHFGACVKDSIIMQKGSIGENAVLENVICDKDVTITAGKRLKGKQSVPLVIAKGTVI
ncbi:MAG: glucose-1-phosphate adenylyltransferase subunit GlgD [Veillonellales bacterium]